ncbi:MAG: DinB family protein [Segetibacter sp.]
MVAGHCSIGSSSLLNFSFGLTECYWAAEYVLYFSSLFGFSSWQTEHGMSPQRQAVIVVRNLNITIETKGIGYYTMIEQSIKRLEYLVHIVPKLLTEIEEKDFSFKPLPVRWSKKEIVGHLIDSATNNHQKFVRGQFEHNPDIQYDQNKWNEFNFYQEIDSRQIIDFWTLYNKQLIEVVKRIENENLARQVKVGDHLLTLEFLIIAYMEHIEHHLKQVITY